MLRLSFSCQYSGLLLGNLLPSRQLCRCQKHPCTKITRCRRENTMSGVPGRSFRCSRNRYPIRCSVRRTRSSGLVSVLQMRAMRSDNDSGALCDFNLLVAVCTVFATANSNEAAYAAAKIVFFEVVSRVWGRPVGRALVFVILTMLPAQYAQGNQLIYRCRRSRPRL